MGYINGTETEKMSEALAEAKNIQSLMNDQRTELSGLAKQTISKSERIIKKFKEMVAGSRGVDRGMRSVLRDMRSLLRFSEGKLKTAKETILTLREKINKVFATLRVFEGMIKAAKEKDARLRRGLKAKTAEEILNGITTDIMTGVDGYRKAKRGDETMSVVTSILGGVTRLTTSIIKAVNRPDVGPKLNSALKATGKAIEIVKQQKDSMEKEVELIIVWKDAVETVKQDVFAGDLKDKREEDAQDLYEEIEGLIEDGDVEELDEYFNGLKDAAQIYLYEEIEGLIEDGDVEELYEYFNGLKDAAQSYLSHIGDKTLNPGDETTLRQTVPLMPPQAGSLVEDVAHFLNRKIDFVGHDNGLRRHIAALQNDFEELNNLDNEAWKHNDHVQKLLTSLTNAVTELRKVEDDVISLARTSRTDVTGLETHLKRFKRQVDGQLSTDDTYSGIMDLLGKLISDSSDIMKKEIEDINEAESMLNTAQAEMTLLKNLLRYHEQQKVEAAQTGIIRSALTAGAALLTTVIIEEDNEDIAVDLAYDSLQGFARVADQLGEFARIQRDILSGFEYIRKKVDLVKKQEKEMRNLREKYEIIKANRDSYDQDELEEIAEEDDDWEEDIMADIRRLKSNVDKFVTSAGHWSSNTYANDYDGKELKETVGDYDNWTADLLADISHIVKSAEHWSTNTNPDADDYDYYENDYYDYYENDDYYDY